MSRTASSARHVYDAAPLGSLIRFYDGTSEPPARHGQERAEWSKANGTGRLMRKTPARDLTVPGFRLHVGNFGGDLTFVQAQRSFTVSSDLRFAILGKPRRGQALVLRDECGGIPTLVHLARTIPEAETWLDAHPGSRARIVPADGPIPRMFTYLNDVDHLWLIVSRADLEAVGLSPAHFSTWSYFCGDCFALDEYGDMPKFLERLDERGIAYRLHDRRTKGDAHVRRYWFRNERPAGRAAGA